MIIMFWVMIGAITDYWPVALGCYLAAAMLIYLFLKHHAEIIKMKLQKMKVAALDAYFRHA